MVLTKTHNEENEKPNDCSMRYYTHLVQKVCVHRVYCFYFITKTIKKLNFLLKHIFNIYILLMSCCFFTTEIILMLYRKIVKNRKPKINSILRRKSDQKSIQYYAEKVCVQTVKRAIGDLEVSK